eukprot:130994_1
MSLVVNYTHNKLYIIFLLSIVAFLAQYELLNSITSIKPPIETRNLSHKTTLNIWKRTPKIIWICWFQGWNINTTPLLTQLVFKSWKYYNEKDGWTIILLDNNNIPKYINPNKWYHYQQMQINGSMGLAGLSDILRIELLSTIGGVWVDATVFCTQSLNEWLPKYVNSAEFFAFRMHPKKAPLSTWFLFANKDSYIINKWHDECIKYWQQHTKMHTYRWAHDLFKSLKSSDNTFQQLWSTVNRFSANIPRFLIRHTKFGQTDAAKLNENGTLKNILHIDNGLSPMYKLRHGCNDRYTNIGNESVLDYLVHTIPFDNISFEHVNKYKDIEQILSIVYFHVDSVI